MSSPADAPTEADIERAVEALERRYWRQTRMLTMGLLGFWLAVTVSVPWFARDLDRWQIGRFPLGFWLNAQGAILVFVALVALYAWIMDRFDRALVSARRTLEHSRITPTKGLT